MCRQIKCSSCGKPTWAGCGMHIDSAMSGVPLPDRCAVRSCLLNTILLSTFSSKGWQSGKCIKKPVTTHGVAGDDEDEKEDGDNEVQDEVPK